MGLSSSSSEYSNVPHRKTDRRRERVSSPTFSSSSFAATKYKLIGTSAAAAAAAEGPRKEEEGHKFPPSIEKVFVSRNRCADLSVMAEIFAKTSTMSSQYFFLLHVCFRALRLAQAVLRLCVPALCPPFSLLLLLLRPFQKRGGREGRGRGAISAIIYAFYRRWEEEEKGGGGHREEKVTGRRRLQQKNGYNECGVFCKTLFNSSFGVEGNLQLFTMWAHISPCPPFSPFCFY